MTAVFIPPATPGVDVTFVGEKTLRPPASANSTAGVPFTSDWGPINEAVRMNSFGEYDGNFGNSPTPGRTAVLGTFLGPGTPGNPGAGSVVGVRMATDAAAASTKTIKNTKAEGGENALELTAIYKGSRGNKLSYVIEHDPAAPTERDRIRLLFEGLTVEKYSYAKNDVTSVAEAINKRSNWIVAKSLKTGEPLATTAGTALAGGNDGSAVTAENWLEALAAFEFVAITTFIPFALDDEAIQASVTAWSQTQAEHMKPLQLVFGGKKGETFDEAISRTEAYEDEHVLSLGAGTFFDELLGLDELSSSEMTARVGGALAGLGEEKALTNVSFAGIGVFGEPEIPTDQLATAADFGITAFKRTSSEEAELKISKGVTSYLGDTNEKPQEIFGDPRLVRVMITFIWEIVEWGEANIVGPTRVTDSTRAAVKAHGEGMLNERLERGLILPGNSEAEKPYFTTPEPKAVGAPEDSIPFEFGWKFARTTNFMIGRGKVL